MAIDSLPPTAAPIPPADPRLPDTIRRLAQQFESLLLAQMLRDMQPSTESADAGMNFGGPLADTLYSELATSLARVGGFGLAASLDDAIARTNPTPPSPEAPTVPAAPLRDGGFTPLPAVATRISSAYGVRRDPLSGGSRLHKGIDIPMGHGDDVRSVQAGTVVESTERTGYGQTIVLDHGNGLTTRYAHLSARRALEGDQVAAGQVLGLAGQTGRATGTHLHFEVRSRGEAIDPLGSVAAQLLQSSPGAIQHLAAAADYQSAGPSAGPKAITPQEQTPHENR